jgi:hypothetical protein
MDGEPPQEEDFSQIPIIERSQHKASVGRGVDPTLENSLLRRSLTFSRTGKPECQLTPTSFQSPQRQRPTLTPSSALTSRMARYCGSGGITAVPSWR